MIRHPLAVLEGLHTPVRTGGVTNKVGYFGLTRRHPDGTAKKHHGVDFLAPEMWPVVAAHDADVTAARPDRAGRDAGYGLLIKLVGGQYATRYAHLHEMFVKAGDRVRKGNLIALVGRTGNLSTATPTHLHFELRVSQLELRVTTSDVWTVVDPLLYLEGYEVR
ncbi:MAG: M23 family metallopeptidase [Acidimicrobiia bacterium]